jgi:predicted permease
MDSLWQDLRFGARMLRKSPAFTAVAIISLAVGIGANTAVFGFVDAALLRPLAVPDPDNLVVLGWRSPAGTEIPDIGIWGWYQRDDNEDGLSSSYSLRAFQALRDRNDVLTATFAFADMSDVNLTYDEHSELAATQVVSGNYHGALGVEPAIGRLIVPDDNRAGASAVAVLSHGYWQRRFGGDADVVGRTVRLNGAVFTVVGVTPPAFRGTLQVGDNPDVTVPLVQQPLVSTSTRDMTQPGFWWLHVMGRLAAGVSYDVAGEQLDAIFHQSVEGDMFPDGMPPEYTLPNVDLRPGFQGMTEQRSEMETSLRIMSAVVALVLLIACINVANLLMARAASRRREIAVRRSIGAGRWRIVRQMLAESVVLSGVAGSLGVAFAVWGQEVVVRALSTRDLYVDGVRTDARVLGFGLLVSLLTGVLFGLVPALRASRPDLTPALKGGGGQLGARGSGATHGGAWPALARRGFFRYGGGMWGLRTLLTTQVALSVLLLVVAGLFVRTLLNLEREAAGFDARGVAMLRIDPGLSGYEGQRRVALHEELQRRLRTIPGVASATVTTHSPVSGRISYTTLKLLEYEPAEDENPGAFYNLVAPGFFETFGIPVLRGRGIEEGDRDGAPMVAVVNEAFAERYFAGDNPIGHRLGLGRDGDPSEYEIVGVSADVKYQQLGDEQYPVAHVDDNSSLTLAWRARGASGGAPDDRLGSGLRGEASRGDAAGLIAAAREVVRQVDPDIPVFDARTLEQQQATTLEMERLFARMSLVLGGLALGLASIGLYGVLSYNVERRTREIGVRRVLGARAADILRVVTGEVGAVLLGALLGLGLASAATGWLESLLYGLTPGDPGTYAAATAVLLAVAVLAAWLPARRASSVDPAIALRAD